MIKILLALLALAVLATEVSADVRGKKDCHSYLAGTRRLECPRYAVEAREAVLTPSEITSLRRCLAHSLVSTKRNSLLLTLAPNFLRTAAINDDSTLAGLVGGAGDLLKAAVTQVAPSYPE
jgi:hypothetical protein